MRRRTELRTLISAGKHLDDCEEMCVQTVCVLGVTVNVFGDTAQLSCSCKHLRPQQL